MFYTDVKLFKDQSESDNVLDDVACMIGCTRSCLNVVASDKGLVVGRVTFLEDGERWCVSRVWYGVAKERGVRNLVFGTVVIRVWFDVVKWSAVSFARRSFVFGTVVIRVWFDVVKGRGVHEPTSQY